MESNADLTLLLGKKLRVTMAVQSPDPKTLGSWEEAFQYPIATVRNLERQLRSDIETNRGRLRTLVGYHSKYPLGNSMDSWTDISLMYSENSSSYRDLLGTAETIIDMDERMHVGETHLARIGKMCNSALVEKKGLNLRTWTETIGDTGTNRR
jgi:conserved oligomeric Golgi complex subunit 1